MNQAKNTEKYIFENIEGIRGRIESSAMKVGRDPSGVRLLAATKNRSVREIEIAIEGGVDLIGENRVQELLDKCEQLNSTAEVHFIGHLQRNKVRQVTGRVELIHSVDSHRLAEEISRRAEGIGIVQAVLVQVNVGAEESKSGLEPDSVAGLLEELSALKGIRARGLSTIAPHVANAEDVRWVFREMKGLGERCESVVEGFTCSELSMGMTNDFEVAIEEGSTIVRIGTALFGERSAG